MKQILKNITFSLIVFIVLFLVAEKTYNYLSSFNENISTKEYNHYFDWKTKENFNAILLRKGIGEINYSTKHLGFRKWGNINSSNKKILIIGDSYTQGREISDGKMYYDILENHLKNIEIYAYGCGGWGSTQEFMLLNKVIDTINPDLIIFQFCHNDLTNNSIEIESKCNINNNLLRRPYLINNEIVRLFPESNFIMKFLVEKSSIIRVARINYKKIEWRLFKSYEEKLVSENNQEYHNAIQNTSNIYNHFLKKINTPFLVFSANTSYGYSAIEKICKDNNVTYLKSVSNTLDSISKSGVKTELMPYDYHWNEKGHEIVGNSLAKEISKYLNME